MRFKCSHCNYEYDECKEGKLFETLPSDWTCPMCGAEKDSFYLIEEECAG